MHKTFHHILKKNKNKQNEPKYCFQFKCKAPYKFNEEVKWSPPKNTYHTYSFKCSNVKLPKSVGNYMLEFVFLRWLKCVAKKCKSNKNTIWKIMRIEKTIRKLKTVTCESYYINHFNVDCHFPIHAVHLYVVHVGW